jgi:hypothetical protein
MDASTLAAGAVAGLTIAAAWLDLRKRTNGSGPLAKKLDEQTERLVRIEDRVGRTEERVGRIEVKVTDGARADRAEEMRVARREPQ